MLSPRNALLLALCCSGAGCGNETERLFAAAARAERNDDYEGAARQLREIVIDHPDSPMAARARLELAQIQLLRTRDITAVHGALVEILDDYPGTDVALEAHRLLARLYEHELQDPERAIPHHLAVLETEEGTDAARETLLSLAECYYRLENLSEAAAAYERAVALPYAASADAAYFRLAMLSRIAHDGETALRWLEAIAQRTEDAGRRYTALLMQVEALMSLERFAEARRRLSQAERLSPGSPQNRALETRLDSAQGVPSGTDGADDLLELQEKIHWGSGRGAR
ncbi:MAG TPA: tetratricopeptide repeat protein [Vicinamibacteria bacterium]|nr:tetratricopeptide repeat protein [Vicinamibacteria bacterium]